MVIIVTWLITGTLDCAAALLLFISLTKQKPALLFRAITSAALGWSKAFSGGSGMVLLGLCFHYLIALSWTVFYFVTFPRLFPCTAVLTNATVYGLFVWAVMNLIVLPLSKAEPRSFSPVIILINIFILIVAIGLPCAYTVKNYPLPQFGF